MERFWAALSKGCSGGESYVSLITLPAFRAAHLCLDLQAASNSGPARWVSDFNKSDNNLRFPSRRYGF